MAGSSFPGSPVLSSGSLVVGEGLRPFIRDNRCGRGKSGKLVVLLSITNFYNRVFQS